MDNRDSEDIQNTHTSGTSRHGNPFTRGPVFIDSIYIDLRIAPNDNDSRERSHRMVNATENIRRPDNEERREEGPFTIRGYVEYLRRKQAEASAATAVGVTQSQNTGRDEHVPELVDQSVPRLNNDADAERHNRNGLDADRSVPCLGDSHANGCDGNSLVHQTDEGGPSTHLQPRKPRSSLGVDGSASHNTGAKQGGASTSFRRRKPKKYRSLAELFNATERIEEKDDDDNPLQHMMEDWLPFKKRRVFQLGLDAKDLQAGETLQLLGASRTERQPEGAPTDENPAERSRQSSEENKDSPEGENQ